MLGGGGSTIPTAILTNSMPGIVAVIEMVTVIRIEFPDNNKWQRQL